MIEVSGFGFPIPFASVAEAVFPDGHNRSDFKVSAAISFSPLERGFKTFHIIAFLHRVLTHTFLEFFNRWVCRAVRYTTDSAKCCFPLQRPCKTFADPLQGF